MLAWRRKETLKGGDVVEYLQTPAEAHMDFGECYSAWTVRNYARRGVECVGCYTRFLAAS
jgi:hypothetical protein